MTNANTFLPPTGVRNIMLICLIVYLAQQVFATSHWVELCQLHFFKASDFAPWQFITYQFMHGSFGHLFWNMFGLWMFGRHVEQAFGTQRFVLFYLVCGIGGGIMQEALQAYLYYSEGLHHYEMANTPIGLMPMADMLNTWGMVGASGSVYGVLMAMAVLWPNERILLLIPPIPLRMKYYVAGIIALEVYNSFAVDSNVAHFAHLGGMAFGWFLLHYWRKQHERRRVHVSFPHGGGYAVPQAQSKGLLQRIRHLLGLRDDAPPPPPNAYTAITSHTADHTYNRQQRTEAEEIDLLLDKIKAKGYDSLTKEEKQRLFDFSQRQRR